MFFVAIHFFKWKYGIISLLILLTMCLQYSPISKENINSCMLFQVRNGTDLKTSVIKDLMTSHTFIKQTGTLKKWKCVWLVEIK